MKHNVKKINFARTLATYMHKHGYTFNREIAAKTGIDETQISKWLYGAGISQKSFDKFLILDKFEDSIEYYENSDMSKDKTENYFKTTNVTPVSMGEGKLNLTIVPIRAQAGFLHGYEKRIFDDELERMHWPFGKGEFWAWEADGWSMYSDGDDSIKPGDYIVTSEIPDKTWLIKDKIYVFITINGVCCKYFDKIEDEKLYMYSANNEYNPVDPLPVKEVKRIFFKESIIKKN